MEVVEFAVGIVTVYFRADCISLEECTVCMSVERGDYDT